MSFASASYVAVWKAERNMSLTLDALGDVGIIEVSDDRSIRVLRRPQWNEPRNLQAYYYALGAALSKRRVQQTGFKVA